MKNTTHLHKFKNSFNYHKNLYLNYILIIIRQKFKNTEQL